ncbi:hypothetical protein [Williamsia sp. 1135]|uniref:hypothetical protein n=1 Tax=Williamsia sp. 1135 TaxID=1889262 RepID=UPI000A0F4BC1|nr:hypothetical protein [Williamsia sp. 1135]ORM35548.1 hypothetical protein BFL43_09555 [Williamsia sp. 1135]
MSTAVPYLTEPPVPRHLGPRRILRYVLWLARNLVAIVDVDAHRVGVTFVLAIAAVPGALLPQRDLNAQKTTPASGALPARTPRA